MPLTAEQKEARLGGIGGTDAAVIAGLSPWKTPVQLWQEKTGRVVEKSLDDNELVQWGHLLEDVIANEWARRNKRQVRRCNVPIQDREFPWMLGNIDRDVVALPGEEPEGLEVKNASIWTADQWGDASSDELPLFYLTQCVHYMRIRNRPVWNVAVLLGGNELRSYRVERDLGIEGQLIELERKFWHCVIDDTPPPPLRIEDLTRLHPTTQGVAYATPEIAELVAEYKLHRDSKKKIETRMDEIKLEVGTFMGEKGDLSDPDAPEITYATYRAHNEKRIDVERLRKESPTIAAEYTKVSAVRKFLAK